MVMNLQFKPIIIDGEKIYEARSKSAQLFCIIMNVNHATEEMLEKLTNRGYIVIIEDDYEPT